VHALVGNLGSALVTVSRGKVFGKDLRFLVGALAADSADKDGIDKAIVSWLAHYRSFDLFRLA
jgi:hypothetical protein